MLLLCQGVFWGNLGWSTSAPDGEFWGIARHKPKSQYQLVAETYLSQYQ
jgi:hypothetical protein